MRLALVLFGLSFSDILDLKGDVLDELLGDRETWFDGIGEVDVEALLQEALTQATSLDGGTLAVGCSLTDDDTLSFDFSLQSSATTSFNSTSIAVLPDSLPELEVEVVNPIIQYDVELPFIISLDGDFVSIGETIVNVDASIGGSISQDLPILPGGQGVAFTGSLSTLLSFGFSSSTKLSFEGSYLVQASVDALNTDVVASLGLQAHDDNIRP